MEAHFGCAKSGMWITPRGYCAPEWIPGLLPAMDESKNARERSVEDQ
jgi:hypothetical protein